MRPAPGLLLLLISHSTTTAGVIYVNSQNYLKFAATALIVAISSSLANADIITDFTGQAVELSVENVVDGDKGFFVTLNSPASTIIGGGVEFTLNIGASGIVGFPNGLVELDFDSSGVVVASAVSQFGISGNNIAPFSFDLHITLPDADVTSVSVGGDLVRGDTSVAGLDPVVWTFENEVDTAFGNVMTFGNQDSAPVPSLDLNAVMVPEPTGLVLALSALCLVSRHRR